MRFVILNDISSRIVTVFSLNFTTAGKGPFMDGEAKNMCQRCTPWGDGGSGVRDIRWLQPHCEI